ncbi:hypothetical protein D018_0901A, partial [Vibrio parahaemolyticus VP2007-007]
MLASNTWC